MVWVCSDELESKFSEEEMPGPVCCRSRSKPRQRIPLCGFVGRELMLFIYSSLSDDDDDDGFFWAFVLCAG